jgi:predicted RNase H-like nuclease
VAPTLTPPGGELPPDGLALAGTASDGTASDGASSADAGSGRVGPERGASAHPVGPGGGSGPRGVRALGADAAGRRGWVGVVVDDDGFAGAHLAPTLAGLVALAEAASPVPLAAIGVDIPIGLVDGPSRSADLAARRYVGPARRSSVFAAPHPSVVGLEDYAAVNELLAELGLALVSKQSFGLFARIREAAALAGDPRMVETFPEASFTAMGGAPVPASKKTWNGQSHRRALLAAADPPVVVPDDLGPAGEVPADDVLDAAACAWSARRVALGTALVFGDPSEVDPGTGRRIAMWA